MDTGKYQQPVPLENQIRFSLVHVFSESHDFCREFTLPFNMISICTRSEGDNACVVTNLENGEVFQLHENDISLVTCNLPQQILCTSRSERHGIHFHLELYPGLDVFSGKKMRVVENSPALRQEADEIFAIKDPVLKLAKCTDFALRFCFKYWPEQYPFDTERLNRFLPVLRNISNSVTADLRVEDLAVSMRLSHDNFTRTFHDLFHRTPKQYLQDELFRRSVFLLLSPNESVKSVADKLRFSSEFNFSRFFKRLSGGISPHDYQNIYSYPAK